jgi:N-carbamoylputrescine amidase
MPKIALVQQRATENREANRKRGLEAVEAAAEKGASVVCFAELAFDPFYPQDRATDEKLSLAEPVPGATVELFQAKSRELGVVIVLNVFERAGAGTEEILLCDVDLARADESHARRLFLRDRRPELYREWLK